MITKKVILCRSCHGEGSRNVLIKEGRYNDADEYERRKCLR